jgi:hypothetical protein
MSLTPEQLFWIEIQGSDQLREQRDAMIAELARRGPKQVAGHDNITRDNVHVRLEHRWGRGNPAVIVQEFVLHPAESDKGNGVMLNRDSTRDHLWVEARWL